MSAVIVFGSKAAGEVIMLRTHVSPLFDFLNRPLRDQGAILPQDLAEVIRKTEKYLQCCEGDEELTAENAGKEDGEPQEKKERVSMNVRFYPLLELMHKAQECGESLHWHPL